MPCHGGNVGMEPENGFICRHGYYEAKIGVLDHGAHLRHSFSLPKIPTLLPLEVTFSNRVENDDIVWIYSDLKT